MFLGLCVHDGGKGITCSCLRVSCGAVIDLVFVVNVEAMCVCRVCL